MELIKTQEKAASQKCVFAFGVLKVITKATREQRSTGAWVRGHLSLLFTKQPVLHVPLCRVSGEQVEAGNTPPGAGRTAQLVCF